MRCPPFQQAVSEVCESSLDERNHLLLLEEAPDSADCFADEVSQEKSVPGNIEAHDWHYMYLVSSSLRYVSPTSQIRFPRSHTDSDDSRQQTLNPPLRKFADDIRNDLLLWLADSNTTSGNHTKINIWRKTLLFTSTEHQKSRNLVSLVASHPANLGKTPGRPDRPRYPSGVLFPPEPRKTRTTALERINTDTQQGNLLFKERP
jgi:hypothetical protein